MAETLLESFARLRGAIPRELRSQLARLGVRLTNNFFIRPPPRPTCSALTRTGTPCQRRCHGDLTMCLAHHKHSLRPVRATCTETTAKGTPCKCTAYRGLTICFSHAKKAGSLPEVPDECPICSCELTPTNRRKTSCGHHFCAQCLEHWAMTKGTPRRIAGRFVHRVSCPMCRKGIHVLTGASWYTYKGKPPTASTTGAEWIERLQICPMSPMVTPEQFRDLARDFGRWLLNHVRQYGATAMEDYTMTSMMNGYGFRKRYSP